MHALTEKQIRASFVNATRREVADATVPDLSDLPWDRLDYLGWQDGKAPLSAYVVLELDGAPTGVLLGASAEAGSAVDEIRDALVADRIAGLRERSAGFVQQIAATR